MITFKYEPGEEHKPHTSVMCVNMHVADGASLDEMCQAFEDFIKGVGYQLPNGVHIGYEYEEENTIHNSAQTEFSFMTRGQG